MNKNLESDEGLMRLVADDRRECLGPLIRRYASPLVTFIYRMIGNQHRSEELFQEVFLTVWLKRKQYQFPRRFRSWLFAIAANRCREDFRRVRPMDVSLVSLDEVNVKVPVAVGLSPDESAVATETAVLISSAIGQLPEQQRTVVVLRVWNGLAYGEIAEIVNCREATVRSHMHHALTALRKYLEPRLAEGD